MHGRPVAAAWLLTALGLAGGLLAGVPSAAAAAGPGTIYTVAGGPGRGLATNVFQEPQAVAASAGRAVYVADGYVVRRLDTNSSWEGVTAGQGVPGFGGDGGPAVSALLGGVGALTMDHAGNLVILDTDNNRVRVVAARSGRFYGQAMTAGDIYTVAGNGSLGYARDGGPATKAELNFPDGVAVDSDGNLAIADSGNNRVRLVAAQSGTFYGQAMTAGHIYIAAGNTVPGSSGNRGLIRNAVLYVPDSGPTESAVTADGGNDLVAQSDQVWFICRISGTCFGRSLTAGHIYQIAGDGFAGFSGDGGPGPAAQIWAARGLAIDHAGNLIIADTSNNRVRVVAAQTGTFYGQAMTAGDIYTVAGDGTPGYAGDGGPAAAAELSSPEGVAVDRSGDLVIGDGGNGRVRIVRS